MDPDTRDKLERLQTGLYILACGLENLAKSMDRPPGNYQAEQRTRAADEFAAAARVTK